MDFCRKNYLRLRWLAAAIGKKDWTSSRSGMKYLAKLTQALLRTSEAERELVLYTARCIEQLVHWNFEGVGDLP